MPPNVNEELETTIRRAQFEIMRVFNSVKKENSATVNITRQEKQTIKSLKAKDCVYLPSDKGGEFCVLSRAEYSAAGKEHLSNEVYEQVKKIAVSTIETRLNRAWQEVSREAGIPRAVLSSYMTHNSDLPRFYHLVKTHKPGPGIKIRPIVSNSGGPTVKLAWLMSRLLRPILDTLSTHLKSSQELLEHIVDQRPESLSNFPYPASLDVMALYTSVPPKEAIQAVIAQIEENGLRFPLATPHIERLLNAITENNYFTFEGQVYAMRSGLPMGSSISSILASAFMYRLEIAPIRDLRLSIYKRYVDDIFLTTTDRDEAERILSVINRQHDAIKFELEHPEDGHLKLLDFSVRVENGQAQLDFYKKHARSDVFMRFDSAIPTSLKAHIVGNEVRRIRLRSTPAREESNVESFREVLRANAYPENWIRENTRPSMRPNRRREEKQFFYLRLPFICDAVYNRVRRILAKHRLPVRVVHQQRSLRNCLSVRPAPACTLRECPVSDPRLCLTRFCVYSLTCSSCSSAYIGSTTRPLHTRIKEHYTRSESSVFKHRVSCNSDFTPRVVCRERDITSLRIAEALVIKANEPSINSRQERAELDGLLF